MPGRKLWHQWFAGASFRRESEALEYAISAGFPLQLPRIIKNIHENIETGIKVHINSLNRLVLMSYIEANKLESMSDISDILFKNIGTSLAHYNSAMQGFDHPAALRNHRWNLVEAELGVLLSLVCGRLAVSIAVSASRRTIGILSLIYPPKSCNMLIVRI